MTRENNMIQGLYYFYLIAAIIALVIVSIVAIDSWKKKK